jgi:hypothetical protein
MAALSRCYTHKPHNRVAAERELKDWGLQVAVGLGPGRQCLSSYC